jgi:RHS repeat-associated protein
MYGYDGDRQRVIASMGAATRVSLYDPVIGSHLLAETDATGGPIGYEYIWFGDRPVAQANAGGPTYWTFADHLDAPTVLTNASGAIVWQADYEPYGQVYGLRTADMHQPLRRLGQEAEQLLDGYGPNGVTARYYNHARWYRPQWGRYTQVDPIGSAGGLFNPYVYAQNDPFNKIDPTGLQEILFGRAPITFDDPFEGEEDIFQIPRSGLSGKETAKDAPSWAKSFRPKTGECGKNFAKRLLDEKYGPGNYKRGPGTEFNRIQKWGDRAFEDPGA